MRLTCLSSLRSLKELKIICVLQALLPPPPTLSVMFLADQKFSPNVTKPERADWF